MNSFQKTKVLMALMGMEIGGAETHVLELCKELTKMGLDVYVASNGGVYETELIRHGIKHFKVPLHNKSPKNLVASYLGLRRIIMENEIELVHSHARIPSLLCRILQKRLHFTFVTTAHLDFDTSLHYKLLTNWGQFTLAVSQDIKKYLIDNYKYPEEKILVTVNGISGETYHSGVDYSDVAAEFSLRQGLKRIVFLSRLEKDTSPPAFRLVEIAAEIHAKNPNTEIIIVGGGAEFERLNEQAKAVNAELGADYIKMVGKRPDAVKFLAAADIFVGVSRAALEALACEKPTILAGYQGYLGIFEKSKLSDAAATNFTCRGHGETTTDVLKRDIFSLLDASPDKLDELAKYGREMILTEYSVERMALDTLNLYYNVRKSPKPIDALISGYYGSNNHGDDALLRAIVTDLREIQPDIKITAISRRPKETKEIHGIDTVRRINLLKTFMLLKRTNLLIMGGGSLIQDLTSTRSLIYYTWIMNKARKRRAKIMLYANGIGPLQKEKNKRLAVDALEKVEKITLRDAESRETLTRLGLKNTNVSVTADAAFRFRVPDFEGANRLLGNIHLVGKKYFCVSIRGWRSLKEDFVSEMAVFCDYMLEKYDIYPLFVPMQPSVDAEISTKVLEKVSRQGYYLEQEFTIEEILAIFKNAEFLVGMRLHSIIYGANVQVPMVGLVYDPKVAAMMTQLGQIYYMKPEEISAMQLITMSEKVMERREEISGQLADATFDLPQKSFENAIIAHEIINRDLF